MKALLAALMLWIAVAMPVQAQPVCSAEFQWPRWSTDMLQTNPGARHRKLDPLPHKAYVTFFNRVLPPTIYDPERVEVFWHKDRSSVLVALVVRGCVLIVNAWAREVVESIIGEPVNGP